MGDIFQRFQVGLAEGHLVAAFLVRRRGQIHGHAFVEPNRRPAIQVKLVHERMHGFVLQRFLACELVGRRRHDDAGAEVGIEQSSRVRRQKDV